MKVISTHIHLRGYIPATARPGCSVLDDFNSDCTGGYSSPGSAVSSGDVRRRGGWERIRQPADGSGEAFSGSGPRSFRADEPVLPIVNDAINAEEVGQHRFRRAGPSRSAARTVPLPSPHRGASIPRSSVSKRVVRSGPDKPCPTPVAGIHAVPVAVGGLAAARDEGPGGRDLQSANPDPGPRGNRGGPDELSALRSRGTESPDDRLVVRHPDGENRVLGACEGLVTRASLCPQHAPNRVEVLEAVHGVGLEIAAFGPFVPAVDVENPWPSGPGQQAFLGLFKGDPEILRRVVSDRVRGAAWRP